MCRRERYCQVSRTKGENGSCIYIIYVLNFNHLVFQRSRLVEGRAGVKLIPKYLKYSIRFIRIMMKRTE